MMKSSAKKNAQRLLSFILVSVFISSFLTSCALTGALVFERFDNYLANYFKKFAEFSKDQEQEIDDFSKQYQAWIIENHIEEFGKLLVELKSSNANSVSYTVEKIDNKFRNILRETNVYFASPFAKFSKSLSETQVMQIESYFKASFDERESNTERSNSVFVQQVTERYTKGFSRFGISLNDEQLDIVREASNKTFDIIEEWSFYQKKWIDKLILILKNKNDPSFHEKLTSHLIVQQDMGSAAYKTKIDSNRSTTLIAVNNIFEKLTKSQRKQLNKKIDLYLSTIDKILLNYEG